MGKRKSAGEGSITKRKDGRWQAALQVAGQRRTVYGKTRKEAAAKLVVLQRRMARPYMPPIFGKHTVGELLDAWLESKALAVKPRTLADYEEICTRYVRSPLGDVVLSRLTPQCIHRLYGQWQLQGKHRTALKIHQVLSQALTMAVRWSWLANNPCDYVDAPRYRPQRKKLWSLDEMRAFLAGTRTHWLHPFWVLAISTGARPGELLALTWEDVDLESKVVEITKSVQCIRGGWVIISPKTEAGVRWISLAPHAVQVLRIWRGEQSRQRHNMEPDWGAGEAVFSSPRGYPLSISTVESAQR